MTNPWIKPFNFWHHKSITAKLSVILVLFLGLLTIVTVAADLSMRSVRNADESIMVSSEIHRLVLEIDQGIDKARHLHSQFFIQYPKVGLQKAHETFAQPSIRKIAEVVSLSKKLQNTIITADVSDALHESKVDLNLFLSSARRFADTSIEAVQLVTKLATPKEGLEDQLDQHLAKLSEEFAEKRVLSDLFHEMDHFVHKHRITRERFLMQSAFNVSFNLHNAIESHPAMTIQKKEQLYLILGQTKQLSEEILETDLLIKARFSDFILQEKSADTISATLVDLARKEVEKSQEKITATYTIAQIVLYTVSLFGLLSAGAMAWALNHTITKRIIRLTRSAEKIREGRLDVTVEDEFQDELGELGQTFNFMTIRIRDLIDNLEEKIARQTKNLQLETERAQMYLDVAGVMLTALDSSGKIRLINQKGCEILNITEREALGQNWFEHYLPERMRKDVLAVFNKLLAGEIKLVEYYENEILTSRGEERMIAFHNAFLEDSEGNIEGILFSGEDITERKQHEAERGKLEVQLRQAHKMEAIGTMAGGIAHDFNNILAAILGYADMAKDDTPDHSPVKYQIDQVLKAANRAKELVKHILSFSRKEAHERVPVQIHKIVTEALKLLRASIPTTIEIKQNIDFQCGNTLADPTQIHQVIMNLCTNAAHSMDTNGGVLEVGLGSANLSADDLVNEPKMKPGHYICLSVKDSGIGIDQKYIDRIFDPYFTTKEVGQGSGMGLSVVIGIVQSYDGKITVKSKLGEGATFNVYFLKIEAHPQEKIVTAEHLSTGTEKILVVDDEESIVDLTKRRIERLGYRVTTKTNSMEALELFHTQPDAFDLVITDQTMPELTGENLAKKLMEIRPNIPIILCTGYSSKMDAEKANSAGISAFIMKPVDKKDLAKTIRQVLDSRKNN